MVLMLAILMLKYPVLRNDYIDMLQIRSNICVLVIYFLLFRVLLLPLLFHPLYLDGLETTFRIPRFRIIIVKLSYFRRINEKSHTFHHGLSLIPSVLYDSMRVWMFLSVSNSIHRSPHKPYVTLDFLFQNHPT